MARLTVIGSGDAFCAGGRGHSCYLLETPGAPPLMVDLGGTALLGLRRAGRSPLELAAIAFTHLHGDHLGGWPFLVIDALYGPVRRQTPLVVSGPPGIEERLEALLQVTYGSAASKPRPFATRFSTLAPGDAANLAGYRVEAFAAEHVEPPEQATCLRVTTPDGAVVAFSGDTAPGPGLLQAAAGAALLVAECSGMRPPMGRHLTWEDWRTTLLPAVSCSMVLLSHLGADVREASHDVLDEARALRAERRTPAVDLAEDGMVLEVPAASDGSAARPED